MLFALSRLEKLWFGTGIQANVTRSPRGEVEILEMHLDEYLEIRR